MEREKDSIEIPSQIVQIWQRIVDSISAALSVPTVMINRLDPPDLEVFCSNISRDNSFPSGTRIPMLGVYCEKTARTRQRLQVEDAREDPQWADSPTARSGIYAYLGYPVFWPGGHVFGTICAVDTKANKWVTPSDTLLRTVKEAIEAHLSLAVAMEGLRAKNEELRLSLSEIKTLRGLLPICVSCKKIRDDKGYWVQLEKYIRDHTEAQFTHGICAECLEKVYPDLEAGK